MTLQEIQELTSLKPEGWEESFNDYCNYECNFETNEWCRQVECLKNWAEYNPEDFAAAVKENNNA